MGKIKGPYNTEFPPGTWVRVANQRVLEEFKTTWRLHHPLESSQLQFASRRAQVKNVSYYHGGDELYELTDVPGIWHEVCLESDQSES